MTYIKNPKISNIENLFYNISSSDRSKHCNCRLRDGPGQYVPLEAFAMRALSILKALW